MRAVEMRVRFKVDEKKSRPPIDRGRDDISYWGKPGWSALAENTRCRNYFF